MKEERVKLLMNHHLPAKGVKAAVKDQHMRHSHHKDTVMSLGDYTVSQNLMRSQDHGVTNRII